MANRFEKRREIEDFLLAAATTNPRDLVTAAATRFGLSRQAVHRRVRTLVEGGALAVTGQRRGVSYHLPDAQVAEWLTVEGLEEHVVWDTLAEPLVKYLPDNVQQIAVFGFTEMVNNVIDHSESERVHIEVKRSKDELMIYIQDFGIGIFEKIRSFMGLENASEALFELSKGKLTTDPARHTGEGIFFTSRMFDDFYILSGDLFFTHEPDSDWLLMRPASSSGTSVSMKVSLTTTRTPKSVYEQFTSSDDQMDFSKTVLSVKLLEQTGAPLVSRSQAKRLLARLARFREVVLNFEGVDSVGQAFADEVFRVYPSHHPEVRLFATNMTPDVESMVNRVRFGPPPVDDSEPQIE